MAEPNKKKRKQKTEVVVQLDRRFRVSFKAVFTLLLFFAGCMGLAFTFALITETRHQINMTRDLVQEKKEENIALRAEIMEKYTLDEIERIAVGRLNMNKPDSSQIVRIYVPKQSYSELHLISEQEDETFWQKIVNFFNGIISFK